MISKRVDVVGAVIVRAGKVLCARRASEAMLGGAWEFPGGKIEPGETSRGALVREIAEELRCEVRVGAEVTTTTHAYDFAVVRLTTFWCDLVAGEPAPAEHAELRWLAPAALDELDWAPADVPSVRAVQAR